MFNNYFFSCISAIVEYFVGDTEEPTQLISTTNNIFAEVSLVLGNTDFPENSIIIVESLSIEDLYLESNIQEIISFGAVNITAFSENGSPITKFDEPVEVCLNVPSNTDSKDACLSFLNDNNEWECEDKCLSTDKSSTNNESIFCGETNHFTTFSILLTGTNTNCDNSNDNINSTITILSIAFICCAIVVVIVGIIFIEIHYRRTAHEVENILKRTTESKLRWKK